MGEGLPRSASRSSMSSTARSGSRLPVANPSAARSATLASTAA